MYKQFILPALLVVFTSVAAIAQSGTIAAPTGTNQKKPQSSAKKSTSPNTQQPAEARTENNLPKGAKTEKRTGNQKGKAKGHEKNKAQGNANGHHKGETPGAEGSHQTGEKHRNGEHAEGNDHDANHAESQYHNGKKRQDDGTDMKKADPSKPAPKKGETSPVKKGKKPAKPGTATPHQRSGGQAPASSGN